MATSMPSIGTGQHIASVNYACTFGGLVIDGGAVSFASPNPVQFVFNFETGRTQPDPNLDLWDITWSYDWFDQSIEEMAIAVALTGICAILSELLSIPQPDVEQAVTVQRVWTFALSQQGSAAPQQLAGGSSSGTCTITEVMPYPPEVSGADTAIAAEAASVSAS